MLFDQVFGTFFLPERRPPADIGIRHEMPATFWGQITAPFGRVPL
jgi:sterol desaturase/sphingolipid hydroxylase (fatty acid hydroxylase superfamily)